MTCARRTRAMTVAVEQPEEYTGPIVMDTIPTAPTVVSDGYFGSSARIGRRRYPHSEKSAGYDAVAGKWPVKLSGPFGDKVAVRIESECTNPVWLYGKGDTKDTGTRIGVGGLRRPEFDTPTDDDGVPVSVLEFTLEFDITEANRKVFIEVE